MIEISRPQINFLSQILGLVTVVFVWLLILIVFLFLYGSDLFQEFVAAFTRKDYQLGTYLEPNNITIFFYIQLTLPFILGGLISGLVAKKTVYVNALLFPSILFLALGLNYGIYKTFLMWWLIAIPAVLLGTFVAQRIKLKKVYG